MIKYLLTILICVYSFAIDFAQSFVPPSPSNAVYQYSVAVGERTAYLWIPPQCRHVRGIIMSLSNLTERRWLEDAIIRQAAAEEGLGIIWLGPVLSLSKEPGKNSALTADMKPGAQEALEKMMKDLADESGYPEMEWAPFIAMGHSANGQFAWNVPNRNAARTIAAIPVKTVPLPALQFRDVPLCYIVGETTEWPQYRDGRPGDRDFFWPIVRDSAIALRTADENNLVGVVTDPGGGHFDWSDRLAHFVALYIHKACRYRLPKTAVASGPVTLKAIDPESGWLTDTGGMDADTFPAAPYKQYKGDRKKAYWFFDEEMAKAAVTFCGDRRKRAKQLPTFVQDGRLLPVAKQGFAALKFEPGEDGITFKVAGGFLPELPAELTGAERVLGHAPGPIKFSVITGPAVQIAPDTFRVQFNRGGMGGAIWLQEEQAGNDQYRHAVQPGQMNIPARLKEGVSQQINFPVIPDQKTGISSVKLTAVSDSGLPVNYYIVAGPAIIEGDQLKFTPVPVKSRYPVKITVVAYQWGRMTAPLYQSAEPVIRSFYLIQK
jgi:hypothetical protein